MVDTATHDQLVAELTGGLAPSEDDLAPFEGSDRLRPDGRPRPEFRAELRRIPNLANVVHILVVLAYPLLVVWGALTISHPLTWVLAFCAMGVWYQRALTLHHESAHRLLFSNRTANDWVGEKLLGLLAFGDGGPAYRLVHTQHHRDEFGEREPDFMLYARYPIPADSMRRKLLRDAFGVSGYKLLKPAIVGLFVKGRRIRAARFFAGQLFVFGLFSAFGHPWLYVVLWWLPWMTFLAGCQPASCVSRAWRYDPILRPTSDQQQHSSGVVGSIRVFAAFSWVSPRAPCRFGYPDVQPPEVPPGFGTKTATSPTPSPTPATEPSGEPSSAAIQRAPATPGRLCAMTSAAPATPGESSAR